MNPKFAAQQIKVECHRYFIQSETEFNSKGNPQVIVNDVRKLHLWGSFIFTDYYCITIYRRQKQNRFSVKQRKKPDRPFWDKSPIKPEDCKMVREGNYDKLGIIGFLRHMVNNPEALISELETCPPENLAA